MQIRNKQGGCKVGEAVYTTAGKLNAKFIIHTVGPRWNNWKSDELTKLENCYNNSLVIAEELNLNSIAFPNISTGIYKFPKKEASEIAIQCIKKHKSNNLSRIIFVCFDQENFNLYKNGLEL